MKRTFFLTGLVLLLMAPLPAHAAPAAVSAAVNADLERAEKALAFIDTPKSALATMLNTAVAEWSLFATTPVIQQADTRIQVVQRSRELLRRTTCLETDIILLETMMERVRKKLNEKVGSRDAVAIVQLADLYVYLTERYELLLRGALDPTVTDTSAGVRRLFDTEEPPKDPVCYYDSNYTPPGYLLPTRDGYGCDAETLTAIENALSGESGYATLKEEVAREREALTIAQATLEQYLTTAATLQDAEQAMENFAAGNSASAESEPPAPRTHLHEFGCMSAPSQGVILHSPKDHLLLSLDFRNLRTAQEDLRPQPLRLRDIPAEFLWNNLRDIARRALLQFTKHQAARESSSFIVSTDTYLTIRQALTPLGAATTKLTRLATDIDRAKDEPRGMRSFVRDFARHTLFTCMAQPCTNRLTQILKLVFADDCFPYATGEYLKDEPGDPRWEKCREAAGL